MASSFQHISSDKLVEYSLLGEGGFGQVYVAKHKDWGVVAVKKLRAGYIKDHHKRKLVNEAKIMSELRHKNIICLYGVVEWQDATGLGLVMEYAANKSLVDFLVLIDEPLNSVLIIYVTLEIITGMNYLHTRENRVLHLDLKAENVMVGENMEIKISDFGLSRWRNYSSPRSSQPKRGTITHIPPERWLDINRVEDPAFDVYSFGILVWELLTGEMPFAGCNDAVISDAVKNGQRPAMNKIPRLSPDDIVKIMEQSWAPAPEQRPSFGQMKELLERSYMQKDSIKTMITTEKLQLLQKIVEIKNEPEYSMQTIASSVEEPLGILQDKVQTNPLFPIEVNTRTPSQAGAASRVAPVSPHNMVLVNAAYTKQQVPVTSNTGVINYNKPTPDDVPPPRPPRMYPMQAQKASDLEMDSVPTSEPLPSIPVQESYTGPPQQPEKHHNLNSDHRPHGPSAYGTGVPIGSNVNIAPGQMYIQPSQNGRSSYLVHNHGRGSTTTIYGLDKMNSGAIQVGDGNTMIVGGVTGKVRRPKPPASKKRPESVPDGACMDAVHMELVAQHVGSRWRQLGRKLGFSEGEMDNFQYDNSHSQFEIVYQMLREWHDRNGSSATVKLLVTALYDIGLSEIAKIVARAKT